MPRIGWPLRQGRPPIEVVLRQVSAAKDITRTLLADTGGGSNQSAFELILNESDCLSCGGVKFGIVQLRGAFTGLLPVYTLRVQIPLLRFNKNTDVVGVPCVSTGLDGIAAFRFLNRFTYGNFGNSNQFALEV
jgi:hypothetical protein